MGGGLLVSMASYQFVRGYALFDTSRLALSCPLSQKKTTGKFSVPTNKIVDANLVLGAAVFGIGWGIGGLCPGPAIAKAIAWISLGTWFGVLLLGRLIPYIGTG